MKLLVLGLFIGAAAAAAAQQSPEAKDSPVTLPPGVKATPEMTAYMANLAKLYKAHSREATKKRTNEGFFFDDVCDAADAPSLARSTSATYTFARFSAAAYCLAGLQDWKCDSHCAHPSTATTRNVYVQEDLVRGTKFVLAVNPTLKAILVIFRGTLNPMSLLEDANLFYAPYDMNPKAPGLASVHAGFLDAYTAVSGDILARVKALVKANPSYNIVCTGHSMGGSLAVLAALHLEAELVPASKIELYTYAAPRAGNADFANFVSGLGFGSITRATYNDDLVPRLPPSLILGYQHHRGEVYYRGFLEKDSLAVTGKNLWDLSLGWIVANSKPVSARVCSDGCGEDGSCIDGVFGAGSILTHLRFLDVVYGPWC